MSLHPQLKWESHLRSAMVNRTWSAEYAHALEQHSAQLPLLPLPALFFFCYYYFDDQAEFWLKTHYPKSLNTIYFNIMHKLQEVNLQDFDNYDQSNYSLRNEFENKAEFKNAGRFQLQSNLKNLSSIDAEMTHKFNRAVDWSNDANTLLRTLNFMLGRQKQTESGTDLDYGLAGNLVASLMHILDSFAELDAVLAEHWLAVANQFMREARQPPIDSLDSLDAQHSILSKFHMADSALLNDSAYSVDSNFGSLRMQEFRTLTEVYNKALKDLFINVNRGIFHLNISLDRETYLQLDEFWRSVTGKLMCVSLSVARRGVHLLELEGGFGLVHPSDPRFELYKQYMLQLVDSPWGLSKLTRENCEEYGHSDNSSEGAGLHSNAAVVQAWCKMSQCMFFYKQELLPDTYEYLQLQGQWVNNLSPKIKVQTTIEALKTPLQKEVLENLMFYVFKLMNDLVENASVEINQNNINNDDSNAKELYQCVGLVLSQVASNPEYLSNFIDTVEFHNFADLLLADSDVSSCNSTLDALIFPVLFNIYTGHTLNKQIELQTVYKLICRFIVNIESKINQTSIKHTELDHTQDYINLEYYLSLLETIKQDTKANNHIHSDTDDPNDVLNLPIEFFEILKISKEIKRHMDSSLYKGNTKTNEGHSLQVVNPKKMDYEVEEITSYDQMYSVIESVTFQETQQRQRVYQYKGYHVYLYRGQECEQQVYAFPSNSAVSKTTLILMNQFARLCLVDLSTITALEELSDLPILNIDNPIDNLTKTFEYTEDDKYETSNKHNLHTEVLNSKQFQTIRNISKLLQHY